MEINTVKFGVIEVDEEGIFTFLSPIIGYENLNKYLIVQYDENSPFKWLQSAQEPGLAFPVTTAAFFDIDYVFEISDEDAAKIELESPDDLIVLNIATIPSENPQNATINLLAPIIINAVNKKAMQLILANTNYSTKTKLFTDKTAEI